MLVTDCVVLILAGDKKVSTIEVNWYRYARRTVCLHRCRLSCLWLIVHRMFLIEVLLLQITMIQVDIIEQLAQDIPDLF